jgi:hypothetical protein
VLITSLSGVIIAIIRGCGDPWGVDPYPYYGPVENMPVWDGKMEERLVIGFIQPNSTLRVLNRERFNLPRAPVPIR